MAPTAHKPINPARDNHRRASCRNIGMSGRAARHCPPSGTFATSTASTTHPQLRATLHRGPVAGALDRRRDRGDLAAHRGADRPDAGGRGMSMRRCGRRGMRSTPRTGPACRSRIASRSSAGSRSATQKHLDEFATLTTEQMG
jgi:hypothetical protein